MEETATCNAQQFGFCVQILLEWLARHWSQVTVDYLFLHTTAAYCPHGIQFPASAGFTFSHSEKVKFGGCSPPHLI